MDIPAKELKIWMDGDMEHKRYEYSLYHDDLCIDLGAYIGEWAERMNEKYDVRVIAVEPTRAILRLNGRNNITVINEAAGVGKGSISFGGAYYYTSAFDTGQGTFYPTFDVLNILQNPVAVLKINVEGMEYQIMERILENGYQKHISNFQIQFHQIEHYPKYYRLITEKLKETHHKTWGVDWVWENWEIND